MAEQEQVLKFELTITEANNVLTALTELPFKISADLIAKIRSQANDQLNPQPAFQSETVEE